MAVLQHSIIFQYLCRAYWLGFGSWVELGDVESLWRGREWMTQAHLTEFQTRYLRRRSTAALLRFHASRSWWIQTTLSHIQVIISHHEMTVFQRITSSRTAGNVSRRNVLIMRVPDSPWSSGWNELSLTIGRVAVEMATTSKIWTTVVRDCMCAILGEEIVW